MPSRSLTDPGPRTCRPHVLSWPPLILKYVERARVLALWSEPVDAPTDTEISRAPDSLAGARSNEGWFVVVAGILTYYLALSFLLIRSGWVRGWEALGVSPMIPVFGDIAVVLAGLECSRLGFAVRQLNPCDPLGREMNYPDIWMLLAATGLGTDHLILVGIGLALLFYTGVFLLLREFPLTPGQGMFVALLLISPSVQFGVERANNDLIIFFLIVVAVLAFARSRTSYSPLALSLITFTGILKLYPIAALGVTLLRRDSLKLASGLAGGFLVYCLINVESLREISTVTPRARSLSYGANVFPAFLESTLEFRDPVLAPLVTAAIAARYLLPPFILVLAFYITGRWDKTVEFGSGVAPAAFLAGASIYMFTFMVGNNWDYRLVFLLLLVPQAFVWLRQRTWLAPISLLLLILVQGVLWVSRLYHPLIHLDEILTWSIFAVLAVLVAGSVRHAIAIPDRLEAAASPTSGG
jgi:hypothetical protein